MLIGTWQEKAVNLNQGLDRWDNRGERSVQRQYSVRAQGITKRLIARLKEFSLSSEQRNLSLSCSLFCTMVVT